MIQSSYDVMTYIHDNLDKFEVADWKISQVHLWKLRGHVGEVEKFTSVLLYVEKSNEFYFITPECLTAILELNSSDDPYSILTEYDSWPYIPTFSTEEYFQKLTVVPTDIEVVNPEFSLLLQDFIDKIKASKIYKEYP